MKQKYTVLLLLLTQANLLFGQKRIEITNSSSLNRENELVKLNRVALPKMLAKPNSYFGLVDQFGIHQQLQFDDLDKDGTYNLGKYS